MTTSKGFRKPVTEALEKAIVSDLIAGVGVKRVAWEWGVALSVVYKLKHEHVQLCFKLKPTSKFNKV